MAHVSLFVLSYSFLFRYIIMVLYNSERKLKMKAARINLSLIYFLVFGTITNASEPFQSHALRLS